MKNIYLASTSFSNYSTEPLELLTSNNFNIKFNKKKRKLTSSEIVEELKGCIGVIAGTEIYSSDVIEKLSELKIISRLGVGLDNIDIESTKKNGVQIFSTQTSPAPAVVELVLGMILNLSRMITDQNNELKTGQWNKKMGTLNQGKTLGIIGLGTIGKRLVEVSKGFRFKIIACDFKKDSAFAKLHNIEYCDLGDLLSRSDIVSIHLNLTQQTENLINEQKLNLMKKNQY